MPFIIRKTITATLLERVKSTPEALAYASSKPDGTGWAHINFQDFFTECERVAFGLMAIGVLPEDRVILLSNTRYAWPLCDFAILGVRALTVPIYPTSTAEDVHGIAEHSGARVLIVENSEQLKKVLSWRESHPNSFARVEKIVVVEPEAMGLLARLPDFGRQIMTLQALQELGRRMQAQDPMRVRQNFESAQASDAFTICYTSGTTGVAKGVVLTHDNLMCVLEDCVATLSRYVQPETELLVSFLPFSHILGRVEAMATFVFGWEQAFCPDLEKLSATIAEMRPTLLFAVPRVFEKAYSAIQALLESTPDPTRLKRGLLSWALNAGRAYYEAIWSGAQPSAFLALQYATAKAIVFPQITQRFGGRLRFVICGGAPLSREIGEFFQIAGIPILEGYGLTETCAPVTVNTPDALRFGSVGRPLPETEIKIAADGEIVIKSRKVFREYYQMPIETREALVDGWFYTGDIGHIDSDGFLHITDRKKDLLITSGGKNIAPQKIENRAIAFPWFSHFVVVGDHKHYLSALVTLEPGAVARFAEVEQILYSGQTELLRHPKIMAETQRLIDTINADLAPYETVKKFMILSDSFSIETGELTPSLKVRRGVIQRKFAREIDRLYASG